MDHLSEAIASVVLDGKTRCEAGVQFTIPGEWKSERKRQVSRGKWTRRIDEPDRVDFKAKVALFASQAMAGRLPLEGPLVMDLLFRKPRTRSNPKNPTKRNPWPNAFWKKPDLTNIVKIAEDGMNGIVYHDDAQVVDRHERKEFGDCWELQVTVHEEIAL